MTYRRNRTARSHLGTRRAICRHALRRPRPPTTVAAHAPRLPRPPTTVAARAPRLPRPPRTVAARAPRLPRPPRTVAPRAPALPAPAAARRSARAARRGRRTAELLAVGFVMRRRPIAVYRVIDEDELLGGDALAGLHDASDPVADRAEEPLMGAVRGAPPRLAAWMGWLPTAAAVGGLVCLAVLLLGLSRHGDASTTAALAGRHTRSPRAPALLRRAAEQSSRPNARHAQSPHAASVPQRAAEQSSRPNARPGFPRPLRPHTGPAYRHRSPGFPRGAPRQAVPPDVALSRRRREESPPAVALAPRGSAANQEFGFER
jgi:hypothetical protein